MLTREQILGVVDRKFLDVDVPEWGGSVRLGSMSAATRDAYESGATKDEKGEPRFTLARAAEFVALSLVDESGALLMGADDVSKLTEKSPAVLLRLFGQAAELNGGSKEKAAGES